MSWLSPVQWAKWTWTAVTGSPGEEGRNDVEDNSDSDGAFDTPEAESPAVVNLLSQLENSHHTDVSNHILDQNSKRNVDTVCSLDNPTRASPNLGSFGLDQNLNLTTDTKPGPEEAPSPPKSLAHGRAARPPSLAVSSPLNKPDSQEVDDEAPVTSHSSSDSSVVSTHDISMDSDVLNGNKTPRLSNEKLTRETNGRIITNSCKVNQNELKQTKDDHPDGHATDEEKLASSAGPDCHVTSKPEESDRCSVYEDTCETIKKAKGSEVQKTGSQVLDSICISEGEKQAVLSLIKDEIVTKESEVGEWKTKYEECRQEVNEMRMIVAEYEKTIAQMIEDEQRNSASSHKALQALTMEKEAALADLNSVERSLSDVFRRYENMKGTIDGFKKNEAVLKKCAQESLARVKQEEQRYQTLKVYAEEKLEKANEEIAQVRAKSCSENMALTASLRKEQIKNESLEQALQQKNQEMEELTKICNELIARMGKVD